MNALDDSSRATYRADLLDEVHYERFGPIPWREKHKQPTPLVDVIRCAEDTPGEIARRVEILNAAMVDGDGKVVRLADRRAA